MRDSWINDASYLSLEAQTDLITFLLGLTLKLTGAILDVDNFKPGVSICLGNLIFS